jgi:ATP-dependent Clp protease ATP-binding subunit ClpC
MALARKEAQRFNHDFIGTEHILLGLIQEGSGVCRQRPEEPGRRD